MRLVEVEVTPRTQAKMVVMVVMVVVMVVVARKHDALIRQPRVRLQRWVYYYTK